MWIAIEEAVHQKWNRADKGGWQVGRSRKCQWLYFRPLVRVPFQPFSSFLRCFVPPNQVFLYFLYGWFVLFSPNCKWLCCSDKSKVMCCCTQYNVLPNQFITNCVLACNGASNGLADFFSLHVSAVQLIWAGSSDVDPSSLSTCDGWLPTRFSADKEARICSCNHVGFENPGQLIDTQLINLILGKVFEDADYISNPPINAAFVYAWKSQLISLNLSVGLVNPGLMISLISCQSKWVTVFTDDEQVTQQVVRVIAQLNLTSKKASQCRRAKGFW